MWGKKNTLLRIRQNSLDLNSLRTDFWRRSMKSSPFNSTTSSLISSVVLVLISFNSSAFFAIITTDDDPDDFRNDVVWEGNRWAHKCWILTPVKEVLGIEDLGFGGKVTVVGEAIERLNIFACLASALSCGFFPCNLASYRVLILHCRM